MTETTWLVVCLLAYGIGGFGTLAFNVCALDFNVTKSRAVLRNALLWPIFLPVLIGAWLQGGS